MGSALAAVFFGLAPALQIARQRQRKTMVRQLLIGAQIAPCCVLLIVSGLLVRAVHHVLYTDPGFGYEQVLAINPGLEDHGYTSAAARNYFDELKIRLRGLPGVTSVALSRTPPLGHGYTSYMTVGMRGYDVTIYPNWVDPEYFQTMSIPLLRGRNILPGEANAVIVSESLARRRWPGEDPIGKPLWPDGTNKDTIVGVTGNARMKSMNDGDAVEAYWPVKVDDMAGMTLVVKTASPPDAVVPIVKSIAEKLDPKLFASVWLLKSGFRENTLDLERIAMLVSLMGFIAGLLAGIGIVGLVAYTVSQHLKEIAIRIALGAKRVQVLAAVLRQFSWPVMLGIVAGAGATAGLSKLLRKVLYGVNNLDPWSYMAAMCVLMAIIAIAAFVPARRALNLDLAKTLHYE